MLGVLPGPHLVESFAPARGLPPLHLRLYRGSTRGTGTDHAREAAKQQRAPRDMRTAVISTSAVLRLDHVHS